MPEVLCGAKHESQLVAHLVYSAGSFRQVTMTITTTAGYPAPPLHRHSPNTTTEVAYHNFLAPLVEFYVFSP